MKLIFCLLKVGKTITYDNSSGIFNSYSSSVIIYYYFIIIMFYVEIIIMTSNLFQSFLFLTLIFMNQHSLAIAFAALLVVTSCHCCVRVDFTVECGYNLAR